MPSRYELNRRLDYHAFYAWQYWSWLKRDADSSPCRQAWTLCYRFHHGQALEIATQLHPGRAIPILRKITARFEAGAAPP